MNSPFRQIAALFVAVTTIQTGQSLAAVTGLGARPTSGPSLQQSVSTAIQSDRGLAHPDRADRNAVDPLHGNPLIDPLDFSMADRMLFIDASDGKLDEHSLVEAALIACGCVNEAASFESSVSPAALIRYRQKFALARDELIGLTTKANLSAADVTGRIELVHAVLHQRLLHGGYDANATDLAATLDTGVYNCASATLLFVALAEELGIDAQAVELPGHVRAVVETPSQRFEVEVTCLTWPDAVRVGARSRQPDSGDQRNVSPLGLLAMIYYNRGVDAFNEHRFAAAVAANRKALLLDPGNRIAYGNMLAAVNNWALALCDAGCFGDAESLLAAGQKFDPDHLAFAHNAIHVRQLATQSRASL